MRSINSNRTIVWTLSAIVLIANLPAENVAAQEARESEDEVWQWLAEGDSADGAAPATPDQDPGGASAPEEAAILPTIPVSQEQPAVEDSPQQAKQRRGSRLIEEIVVTAQKREEALIDVPISVTALSAEQLDAKQIVNVGDLPKIAPGLTITTQTGFSSLYLRGVGSDAYVLGDPVVVTYFDDVYSPFGTGNLVDFGAIEQVEVLKGPQGTLFGRNALGGAIRIKTKDPNLRDFEADASAGYGTHDAWRVNSYVSLPLIEDHLALSASFLQRGGKYHLTEAGQEADPFTGANAKDLRDDEEFAYRAKLKFAPTDWMTLQLSAYQTKSDGSASHQVLTEPSLVGAALLLQPQDARSGVSDDTVKLDAENRIYWANAVFNAPWFDLKLNASKQDFEGRPTVDFDGSFSPIAQFESAPAFSEVETAEFQFLSNGESWGADRFTWIFGGYYFRQRAGFNPAYLHAGSGLSGLLPAGVTNVLDDAVRGLDTINDGVLDLGNLVSGLGLGIDNLIGMGLTDIIDLTTSVDLGVIGILASESKSLYSQVTLDITDWLAITGGVRYQREDKAVERSTAGLYLPTTDPYEEPYNFVPFFNYTADTDPSLKDYTESLDPKVSLEFRPDGLATWGFWSGPLFYATYQTATLALTYNAINIIPGNTPEKVRSSKIEAYEVGFKGRLWNDDVQLSMAAFRYKFTDPLVQFVSLQGSGAIAFENAEEQMIKGLEADVLWNVLPGIFNNNLIITGNVTLLDAIFTSYTNGSGFEENTGVFFGGGLDFSGNRIPRTPEYSYSIGILQTFDTAGGPLEIGVDWFYTGDLYYLAQQTDNIREDAYGLLGASVGYLIESMNLRLALYARNILDKEYNQAQFLVDFGRNELAADGRNIGFKMSWSFN